jgi:hypothetical protein
VSPSCVSFLGRRSSKSNPPRAARRGSTCTRESFRT